VVHAHRLEARAEGPPLLHACGQLLLVLLRQLLVRQRLVHGVCGGTHPLWILCMVFPTPFEGVEWQILPLVNSIDRCCLEECATHH